MLGLTMFTQGKHVISSINTLFIASYENGSSF